MALTQVSTGGIKDGQVQTADLADGQVTVGKLHADALDRTYTLGADGSNHYTFTGEGLTGAVNDPTLYLTRGKTYRFVNGNSAGAHPFRIQTTVNGSAGTEYNTGVTNNGGAGGSTIVFEVPHDAPDVLYYQCTSHNAMGGILYVTGALADGTVTTAKIADQAVTLAKLPHGTSSNDGKFLRANNGADPTFETIPPAAITAVGSTGANRVITDDGDGTVTAEGNLNFTGDRLLVNTSTTDPYGNRSLTVAAGTSGGNTTTAIEVRSPTNGDGRIIFTDSTSSSDTGSYKGQIMYDQNNDFMQFGVNGASEAMRIVSNKEVGINVTNPEAYGANGHGYGGLTVQAPSGSYSGITIKSGYNGGGALFFADGSAGDAERRNLGFASDHVNKRLNWIVEGSTVARFTEHGFHPNPADSAAANALDDYEEGTFTATMNSSGGNASFNSGGTATGLYVKIGSMVHVQIYFSGANISSAGSGVAVIGGLPFTSNSTSYYTLAITHNTMTVGTLENGYVQYGNTIFYPIVQNGTGGSALNVGNPRYIMIGGSYPTAF